MIPAEYLVRLRAASPAAAVPSKYATRPPLQCAETTEPPLRSRHKKLAVKISLLSATALKVRLVVLPAHERAHSRIGATTASCNQHITASASTTPSQSRSGHDARANAFNENTADPKLLSPLLLAGLAAMLSSNLGSAFQSTGPCRPLKQSHSARNALIADIAAPNCSP